MKYYYAVYRVLVIFVVFMAGGNGLKAKAEYGDNFIFVLNETRNQTASDLECSKEKMIQNIKLKN